MKLSEDVKNSLKELVGIVGDDVQEIEIVKRFFGWRIRISRAGQQGVQVVAPAAAPVAAAPAPAAPAAAPAPEASESQEADGPSVLSPMVGTFYRAPSPDADAFVKEGDTISVGQTVCIIEAMKIMNEIESEVAGRVTKILVENGSPVEYNTPLFLVEPV